MMERTMDLNSEDLGLNLALTGWCHAFVFSAVKWGLSSYQDMVKNLICIVYIYNRLYIYSH